MKRIYSFLCLLSSQDYVCWQDFMSSCKVKHQLANCNVMHELRIEVHRAESLQSDGRCCNWSSSKLVTAQLILPGNESWKLVLNQEADKLTGWLEKHEHENGVLWHDKVLTQYEFPLPRGKRIVKLIPYEKVHLTRKSTIF